MTAGRPRKPLEEKLADARGTGRDRGGRKVKSLDENGKSLALTEPNKVIPEPPPGLMGRGTVEWMNLWSNVGWLHPDQDYHYVEQVVRAYDDMAEFRQQIRLDGLMVKGYAGQQTANPLIKEIRACEKTIRDCLSKLGISPTDRVKLGLNEIKREGKLKDLQGRTKQQQQGTA